MCERVRGVLGQGWDGIVDRLWGVWSGESVCFGGRVCCRSVCVRGGFFLYGCERCGLMEVRGGCL